MEVKGSKFLSMKEEYSTARTSGSVTTMVEESRISQRNGHASISRKTDSSEVSVRKNCFISTRKIYDVQTQSLIISDDDRSESKSRKERDKEGSPSSPSSLSSSPSTKKSDVTPPSPSVKIPTPNNMDQDLEFYPIDDFNSSPSTFTAWDAFMAGNQAFFREPCCVPDYSCLESFAYMDVIPEEDASVLESDTDDTGSSVSTVIDKFSRTSTANSSFSERIKTKDEPPLVTFDLEQVLSPFEQLEKELDEGNGDLISHSSCSLSSVPTINGDCNVSSHDSSHDFISAKECKRSEVLMPINSSEGTENPNSFHAKSTLNIKAIPKLRDFSLSSEISNLENHQPKIKTLTDSNNSKTETSNASTRVSQDKPFLQIPPPVPTRTRFQNVSTDGSLDRSNSDAKSNNSSPQEKKDLGERHPQHPPPPPPIAPRKRETYPTPTVPPRMSKHLPARRTRSDPGCGDSPTRSRIPRPTFITRSSTFTERSGTQSSPLSTTSIARCASIPKNVKIPSPKMSPVKKLRFSEENKLIGGEDETRPTLSSQTPDIQSVSFITATTEDKSETTSDNLSTDSCSAPEEDSDYGITSFSTVPRGLFSPSTTENEYKPEIPKRSSIPLQSPFRPNKNPTTEPVQKPIQTPEENDENSFSSEQQQQHIRDTINSENDTETRVLTINPKQAVNEEVDAERKPTAISIPKIEVVSEGDECHTNLQESEDQEDKEQQENVALEEKGISSGATSETEENCQTTHTAIREDKIPHHRSLEDILQALDNLCLMSAPKDIEINIDWGPVGEGMVNITEKILAPGSASIKGSDEEDAIDHFEKQSLEDQIQPFSLKDDDHGQQVPLNNQEPVPPPLTTLTSVPTASISSLSGNTEVELQEENSGRSNLSFSVPPKAVEEPQQPTQEQQQLTVGGESPAPATLSPETPAVSPVGPNVGSDALQAPEVHHAPSVKGHCQQDTLRNESADEALEISAMDTLNKLEKKVIDLEESLVPPPFGRQPPDGHEFPANYTDPFIPLNNHIISETEDTSSTRHSSGCDDSGVFLEDTPYVTETCNTTLIESKHKSPLITTTSSERLDEEKAALSSATIATLNSSNMRQYSIETQGGVDSDAEKSDDMGLASSSVDSADDLDSDPSPAAFASPPKSESPIYSPLKPPPVPCRMSLSNGHSDSTKDQTYSQKLETTVPHATDAMKAIRNIERIISNENINSSVSDRRLSFQNESCCKWKSEECLRSALENKWSLSSRHNEKSISVKDRIAMFSGMESDSNQLNNSKKEETLHRFSGESGVKHAQSTETLDRKCDMSDSRQNNAMSNGFSSLNRETKWYSMYNITPTTVLQASTEPSSESLKSASSIPSLVSSGLQEVRPVTKIQSSSNIVGNSSSNNVNPLKVDTETHRHLEKPIISSYPQTQLTNNKRYNYGLYSLKPLRTSEDLTKKGNGGLLSIIDPCKQQLPKLKGLVIPDRPPLHSSTSKALPTIVSSESLFPAKSDIAQLADAPNDKEWKRASFPMTATSKTMSLPRSASSRKDQRELATDKEAYSQKHSPLAEPPWKSGSCSTLPKYSPAFKRRTLELPHGLGSSLSPTPPSSITSPMSPPPSSPSSVCSSNASSSSIAAKQQNIFQFSLSHSKPVTPVLPEKPIMSPPSLPSDVEYEGDNSEDSTTSNSVSPMLSTQISMKNLDLSISRETGPSPSSKTSPESLSFLKTSTFSSSVQNVPFQSFTSETMTNAASYQSYSNGAHHSGHLEGLKSEVTSTKLKQQFCINKTMSAFENTESQNGTLRNSSDGSNNRNDMVTLRNAVNIMNSSQEVNDSAGNRNGFSDIRPEVVGKFHAQPVSVSEAATKSALAVTEKEVEEFGHKNSSDKNGFCSTSEVARNCYSTSYVENGDGKGDIISRSPQANGFGQDKLSWAHSDLISYKNTPVESDDDSHSSLSQRTEDSRHTTDECLSDATTDSLDKNVDPELRPRRLSQQRTVLRAAADSTDSVQKFRALAEKWEQRSEHRDIKSPPPVVNTVLPTKRESKHVVAPTAANAANSCANTNNSNISQSAAVKLPPSLMPRHHPSDAPPPERRISVPSLTMYNSSSTSSFANGQRRESRSLAPRPASLIEDKEKDVFDSVWNDSTPSYVRRTSVKDGSSNIDFLNSKKLSKSQVLHTGSRDSLDSIGIRSRPSYFSSNKSKSISVSDIRKAFETQCQQTNASTLKLPPRRMISEDNVSTRQLRMTPPAGLPPPDHRRISSIDSTASESDVGTPVRYGSVGSLTSISRDPYGSVTSLASSTSIISPQELQQLIDEANQSLEEAGNSVAHELLVVVLHREIPGGSIGITLAGGADYEVKEITVHKVISGSLADRDGRIRKGDRVISINGRNLKGITHRDALEILKAPRPEVVLVISREITEKGILQEKRKSLQEQEYREQNKSRENARRKYEDAGIVHSEVTPSSQEQLIRVELLRDSTGLGFSIEGGKDSPLGDRPLTIKRIFKNGVANKEGQLDVNDEIVSVNGQPVTSMTRTEAWNFMKKLPEGPVILLARKAGQGSS